MPAYAAPNWPCARLSCVSRDLPLCGFNRGIKIGDVVEVERIQAEIREQEIRIEPDGFLQLRDRVLEAAQLDADAARLLCARRRRPQRVRTL